jgi:ribosomal protein S18 acetylase RimI-like enzyme
LADLVRIDHAAFPWLWWNSPEEFVAYGGTPGVQLFVGRLAGRVVAYVGLTHYLGWGHLDRIAVEPAAQGQGLGGQALAFAIGVLLRSGARRVGLSTQRRNVRSQRLYERFGFRRSPGYDYRLYGAPLREVEEASSREVEESARASPRLLDSTTPRLED